MRLEDAGAAPLTGPSDSPARAATAHRSPVCTALVAHVIPAIVRSPRGQARVWVPGCGTGEMAYLLAVLLHAAREGLANPPEVKVFATDADAAAIEEARRGRSTTENHGLLSSVALQHLVDERHGDEREAPSAIRASCTFAVHDVLRDPPFQRVDLIACGNLLSSFARPIQEKVLLLFHHVLTPGGYLYIARSDDLERAPRLFRVIDEQHRIFQKRDTGGEVPRPFPIIAPQPQPTGVARELDRVLLQQYAPPAVLVDREGQILHASASAARFLGPGIPSALGGLPPAVRARALAALREASRSGREVLYDDLTARRSGSPEGIDVIARPLHGWEAQNDIFMVIFREMASMVQVGRGEPAEDDLGYELRATLQRLSETREAFDDVNEQHAAAQEELAVLNGELQAANEALQASMEELQTVNCELTYRLAALDRANGDLRNLFASTHVPTLLLDGALCITKFSPDATALFRLIEKDVGRPITDIVSALAGDDLEGDARRVLATLVPAEREVREKQGERWYIRRIHAYRSVGGAVDGVVITFGDITALKRAEAGLREADRRKDHFFAMLGHELRNPLAPIRNAAGVLRHVAAADPAAVRASEMIERQVAHVTRLLDDLLDTARLASGKILLRKARFDLVELVRSAMDEHRADAEAADLSLSLSLPDRPLWMLGDATRIAQCVSNMLTNAVKFTGPGGRVEVSAAPDPGGRLASVRVRDTGIGVEPAAMAALFEPFIQADRSIDRSRGGLGLGLSLVKAFAEMHGGSAAGYSEGPGRGAEFTVRLPLDAEAPPSVAVPPERAGPSRVLVIEDNVDAADSMRMLLELSGHEVAVAHDGTEGVKVARQFRPALVLCDIGLPGALDGYGVAQALSADPDLHGARLVALTGYGQDDDKSRAREAGFAEHMTKPISPEMLERVLARAPLR